jgi:hypothetical protein
VPVVLNETSPETGFQEAYAKTVNIVLHQIIALGIDFLSCRMMVQIALIMRASTRRVSSSSLRRLSNSTKKMAGATQGYVLELNPRTVSGLKFLWTKPSRLEYQTDVASSLPISTW